MSAPTFGRALANLAGTERRRAGAEEGLVNPLRMANPQPSRRR